MPRKSAKSAKSAEKNKECTGGKVINPLTGRCVNPCPPGTIRNEKGRCVKGARASKRKSVGPKKKSVGPKIKRKSPKRKECPPGKVRNPKTNRCVFSDIREITIRNLAGDEYIFSIDNKNKKAKVSEIIEDLSRRLDIHHSLLRLVYMKEDGNGHELNPSHHISQIPYVELSYVVLDHPQCPPGILWNNKTGGCHDREVIVREMNGPGIYEYTLHSFIVPHTYHHLDVKYWNSLRQQIRHRFNIKEEDNVEEDGDGGKIIDDRIKLFDDDNGNLCLRILPINPFKFVFNYFFDKNVGRHVVDPQKLDRERYYIIMKVKIDETQYERSSGYSPTYNTYKSYIKTIIFLDTDDFPQNYVDFADRTWSYEFNDGNWERSRLNYRILSFKIENGKNL